MKRKKRIAKKGATDNALSIALSELSNELSLLAKQKNKIKYSLDKAKKKVADAQKTENILRSKLTELATLEARSTTDIGEKEHKLLNIRDKINKVRMAREELS